MPKYIALLRGINVGGHKRIIMKDLVTLFSNHGLTDVSTYIQSGNIFFNVDEKQIDLPQLIHNIIQEAYGYDVPVIIRSRKEISKIFKNNPYPTSEQNDLARCHITFLSENPSEEKINRLNEYALENEHFTLMDKDIYLQTEGSYSQSKMTNKLFESKLKVRATTRNWKTMIKLHELSSNN